MQPVYHNAVCKGEICTIAQCLLCRVCFLVPGFEPYLTSSSLFARQWRVCGQCLFPFQGWGACLFHTWDKIRQLNGFNAHLLAFILQVEMDFQSHFMFKCIASSWIEVMGLNVTVNSKGFDFWGTILCILFPHTNLPYLSSQMFTGYHPLFTNGDTRSQVLSHRYKRLLKDFKITQLPLNISSKGSTLCTNKHKQKRLQNCHIHRHPHTVTHMHWGNITNISLQSQAFQHTGDCSCSVCTVVHTVLLYTKEFQGKQYQFHFSRDVHFINNHRS